MITSEIKFQAQRQNPGFKVTVRITDDMIKVAGYGSGRSGEFFKAGNLLSSSQVVDMGGIAVASQYVKNTIRQITNDASGNAAKILIGMQRAFPNDTWQQLN